jgi:hypothetical protein
VGALYCKVTIGYNPRRTWGGRSSWPRSTTPPRDWDPQELFSGIQGYLLFQIPRSPTRKVPRARIPFSAARIARAGRQRVRAVRHRPGLSTVPRQALEGGAGRGGRHPLHGPRVGRRPRGEPDAGRAADRRLRDGRRPGQRVRRAARLAAAQLAEGEAAIKCHLHSTCSKMHTILAVIEHVQMNIGT